MDTMKKHERDKCRYRTHRPEVSSQSAQRHLIYKITVMTHYSGGTPSCTRCGITDLDVLTIDHIHNNGNKDRTTRGVGTNLYRSLINEGFPKGFQVLCCNCNHKKEVELRRKRRAGHD